MDDDLRSPEPAPVRPAPEPQAAVTTPALAAGPAPAGDRDATEEALRDRVESVPHVVQRGENFWTISQLYYGSGRFYKALWWANQRTVPAIDRLYVGQSLRIPPPEALDRSRIEPARPAKSPASANARASETAPPTGATAPLRRASSRTGNGPETSTRAPGELEVALPTSDPFARRDRDPAGDGDGDEEPATGPRPAPRRPLYKVRPYDTLRSIARKTLGNSRRSEEILDLNADVISDPQNLPVGQVLELPDDAQVGEAGTAASRRASSRTDP